MRLLFVSLLCAVASVAQAADADRAPPFTPEQRDAIVDILRQALRRDPTILRDAVTALQDDDQQRADAATRGAILAAKESLVDPADPTAGNPQGDVTIVEFFDTRCPYCRKLEPAMNALLKADSGVRLVFKDLPILGAPSVIGARALLAAQAQGAPAYLRLRDALMLPGAVLTVDAIADIAAQQGLDAERLKREMDSPAIDARLLRNLALSKTLGLQGTPALVIGTKLLAGATDLAELTRAVADARSGG